MSKPVKGYKNPYVSARKWASIVCCGVDSVGKVAAAAGARIQQLPGLPTRYHLEDAHAIAAQSRRVAGEQSEPAAVEARRPAAAAV